MLDHTRQPRRTTPTACTTLIAATVLALSVIASSTPLGAQQFVTADDTPFLVDGKDLRNPPRPARLGTTLKTIPGLLEAARVAADPSRGDLEKVIADAQGLGHRAIVGDTLRFEIVEDPSLHPISQQVILELDGSIARVVRDRIEGSIALTSLEMLTEQLPEGAFVEPLGHGMMTLDTEGEGPTIMRSGPYRDMGYDGTGIKIAVIDIGYDDLLISRLSGDAPASSTDTNYTDTSFEDSSDGDHGRFVTETIYDHAPGAEYYIYKVGGQASAAQAVDDAVLQGCHIISMSLGWTPDQWNDGGYTITDAFNDAGAAGVLAFNSAGNSADEHWQGQFEDDDNDGFHEWQGTDEALQVTVAPGDSLWVRLLFDPAGGAHDYDLHIYNQDGSALAVPSPQINGESSEVISFTNASNFNFVGNIVVEHIAGPGTEIEIYGGRNTTFDEHLRPQSSLLCPSDATHANAISVGAVEQAAYGSPEGTCCIQALYSSRGPTNDLTAGPDICAPTSTGGSFFNSFVGTSCACPHAAGVCAVLWSVNPAGPAAAVRQLLYQYAEEKDWGVVIGQDSTYGRGGVNLPELKDCNFNGFPDAFDIANGSSSDNNQNGRPDECDPNGFEFGILDPDLPPIFEVAFIAQLIPEPATASPSPDVFGVDMVFGFDPSIVEVVAVEPAQELIDLLGGPPVEFFSYVDNGVIGVTMDFGVDPVTGGPLAFAVPVTTDMLRITTATLPGTGTGGTAGGPSGPPIVNFGFEDQPVSLLLPAVQKVRAAAATGSLIELTPTFAPLEASVQTTLLPAAGYSFSEGTGFAADDPELPEGSMRVEVDPTAPLPEFSVRTKAREVYGDRPVETLSLNFGVEFDAAILIVVSVLEAEQAAGLSPEFFDVDLGTDGVGIGCTWGSTVPGGPPASVLLGGGGVEIAELVCQTQPGAIPAGADSGSTLLRFAVPSSVPTAQNLVTTFDGSETPHLTDGVITFVTVQPPASEFRRGDVNSSGGVDIADAINALGVLFTGEAPPACEDAMDANDDGVLNIADPIALLAYLFQSEAPPPAPGPTTCGEDPTADTLECDAGGGC